MSGKIFINYRRDDSSGSTGRLYDRLAARFPKNQIFIDVDNLDPGVDFVEAIKQSVGSCDVLIAVIGRRWLISSEAEGTPFGVGTCIHFASTTASWPFPGTCAQPFLSSSSRLQVAPDALEGGAAIRPLCLGFEVETRLRELLGESGTGLDPGLPGQLAEAGALFFVVHPFGVPHCLLKRGFQDYVLGDCKVILSQPPFFYQMIR